jgi:hypothetical protein
MRNSVAAALKPFQLKFEGEIGYMYCDSEGLVTTYIGNLIDPMPVAQAIEWIHQPTKTPAQPLEIVAEWQKVKTLRLPADGMGPRTLELSPEAANKLFWDRADANEKLLAKRWKNWADLPADAQLLGHSLAWAAGAAYKAPHLDADVLANTVDSWRAAGGTPFTNGNNPALRGDAWLRDTYPADEARGIFAPTMNRGLRPRNLANQELASNVARCLMANEDPDVLIYKV